MKKKNRKVVKNTFSFLCMTILLLFAISFPGCGDEKTADTQIAEDFIQPWLCEDWTVEQWEQHLLKLKEEGYSTIILQSSAEVQDGRIIKTYFINDAISCEQKPTIERLFTACEKVGFETRVGLLNDSAWWGKINDEKVTSWNSLGATITNLLYEKLSDNAAFAGFYWTFEFYTQDKGYEVLWAQLINAQIELLSGFDKEYSLLFSPYYSTYYRITEKECYRMWTTFFKLCKFRNCDIFAPQDGYGGGKAEATVRISKRVRAHLSAASIACKENSNAQFYVNIEMFTNTSGVYASKKRISHQKYIASEYGAKGLISFSYSHYYCN